MSVATVEKITEEPTTASFHFRDKGKVQPVGYEGLGIDQEATIILKGKISRLGVSSWERGKGFELTISSCEISGPPKTVTIDAAVKHAASSGKKVK
jgi:hypothetical protein